MEDKNILAYFGPYKIAKCEVLGTTDGGDELLEVHFDGKEEKIVLAKRALVEATTAEPVDLTQLRNIRYEKLVERLRRECVESGVGYDDTNFVCKSLEHRLLDQFDLMLSTFLKKPFCPGISPFASMTTTEAYVTTKRNLEASGS